MKNIRFLGLSLVSLLMVVSPVVHAAGPTDPDSQGKKVRIDSSLIISKFEDGRVAPVQNADKLTGDQVDNILLQMNVTEDEIKTYSKDFKKKLVSRGGIKVDVEIDLREYYNSLSGESYLVTEENKDSIDLIKQKDMNTINNMTPKSKSSKGEVQTLAMGSYTSPGGKFIGGAAVFFLGKTSNNTEYKYDYYTTYDWYPFANNGNGLNFYFHDTVAHAWQSHTTSVLRNGANNLQIYSTNPSVTQTPFTVTPSISGSSARFDIYGNGYHEWGALHDEVRIPVSNKGTTGSFVSSYAHPWSTGVIGVNIKVLFIDWNSFTGDKYDWASTFTISNT